MKKRKTSMFLISALAAVAVTGALVINKKIKINPVFAGKFEIVGVDVSHYQGTIDWKKLAEQDLEFAYIKATEGSGHLDECFYDNWQEAEKTDLCIGAYHFFSFDSDGKKQAEFYIDTAGDLNGKMAPMVDVEFYGDKKSDPPEKDEVARQLGEMLETLEEHYQMKPVIYTTYRIYNNYIRDEFDEYPLWIRNVYYPPLFVIGEKWTFWQYTDTAFLDGYEGAEEYIDMNVFRGTQEELEQLIVRCEKEITAGETEPEVPKTTELTVTDNRGDMPELEYTDKESFLKDFELEDKEPFYHYCDESGKLQVELYYDERTGRGYGIRYSSDEERELRGFLFNGSRKSLCDSEFLQERILSGDCCFTHGKQEYYCIYQGEEMMPSYCLVLDHDAESLYAELVSLHDIIEDENRKRYGVVGPDLSDNCFAEAVRKARDYKAEQKSHTYGYDYDGDGNDEAFVIIGDCLGLWGDVIDDGISGDAWFVDCDNNVTFLGTAVFTTWQEYIRQDGKMYLLLTHDIGIPWITDIYTVQNKEPVICGGSSWIQRCRSKYLNDAGQVIQIQDAYDECCDSEWGWSGHTWKPYTFEFDHGELRETGAKEVTLKEVAKMASLPDSFDAEKYDDVQYILRDNGELNINTASCDTEYEVTDFKYFTFYIGEKGEWELTDEGPGIYRIQLDGESSWDYCR